MPLTIRKLIVLGLIGSILLMCNILFVAEWLAEKGVVDWARDVRAEYLTGTAMTIILVLLILLVSPKASGSGLGRQCPVCDRRMLGSARYCSECGSNVV